jgi:hypothetical protein
MRTLEPALAGPAPAPGRFAAAFARLRDVRGDQQGAIMVLGIFMCSCIVGLLWYIAGIGDAIVYRERMQEAADAVAFSGATLHARGMNLIVLLNLLMAVILAVRVALKMLILVLGIATVFFTALAVVPFMEWAGAVAYATGQGATQLQNILSDIDPLIDDALVALHEVEEVLVHVVPIGASAGAIQVGEKYKPPVDIPAGTDFDEFGAGLPLTDGTEDMLCRKAGEAVATVIGWPLSIIPGLDKGMSLLRGILGSITESGAAYFCEMGSGGKAPNLDSIYDNNAKQVCDRTQDGNQKKYDQASAAWHQACNATNPPATCNDPDPLTGDQSSMTFDQQKLSLADINHLKSLENDVDHWHQEQENFDYDQCKKDQKKQMQQTQTKQQSNTSNNSGNKKPMMVKTDWKNGVNNSQFLSLITGETKTLEIGVRGVKVGAFKDHRQNDPAKPPSMKFSFAQAEFFYDCSGDWDSSSCNNEEDTHESAMWHFRWRARLRRFNEPNAVAKVATDGALLDFGNQFRRWSLFSTDRGNEMLRLKLQQVALSGVRDAKEVLIIH